MWEAQILFFAEHAVECIIVRLCQGKNSDLNSELHHLILISDKKK